MTQPSPQSAEAQAAMTVAECADQLRQRHPALFDGPPKPVKLRIQHDIQERNPGVFSKQTLAAFFRRYTNSGAYLKAIVRGTHRYDLDGQPAGEISDEHRQVAETALKERQARIDAQRAEERAKAREQERAADQERIQRATLLRDFETTTLTRENFCALKGVPADQLEACLPSLEFMMEALPMQDIVRLVFQGSADCAEVKWTLFGMSIPEWSLLGFIGMLLFCLFQLLRRN